MNNLSQEIEKIWSLNKSQEKEISIFPETDKEGILQNEVKIPVQDIIITDYQDTIYYQPELTVITEEITDDKKQS